jgi:hypothetical protein
MKRANDLLTLGSQMAKETLVFFYVTGAVWLLAVAALGLSQLPEMQRWIGVGAASLLFILAIIVMLVCKLASEVNEKITSLQRKLDEVANTHKI